MANYKETAIAGEMYVRAGSISIQNPKNGLPELIFHEERWINIPGNAIAQPVGSLTVAFEPQTTIPLISPIDDTSLGQTVTQMDLQVILYSLYRQQAALRDETNPNSV